MVPFPVFYTNRIPRTFLGSAKFDGNSGGIGFKSIVIGRAFLPST